MAAAVLASTTTAPAGSVVGTRVQIQVPVTRKHLPGSHHVHLHAHSVNRVKEGRIVARRANGAYSIAWKAGKWGPAATSDVSGGLLLLEAARSGNHNEQAKVILSAAAAAAAEERDGGSDIGSLFGWRDEENWTALMHASWNGHAHICSLILSAAAVARAKVVADATTKHAPDAIKAAFDEQLAHLKIHQWDMRVVDAKNSQGNTALMLACWKGHLEIVRLLLRFGADMHKTTDVNESGEHARRSGKNALWLARHNNHFHVVSFLRSQSPQLYGAEQSHGEVWSEHRGRSLSDFPLYNPRRTRRPLKLAPPGGFLAGAASAKTARGGKP